MAAQLIASTVNYPSPEEAYTCGLLHNIGQLMLANILKPNMIDALKKILALMNCCHWSKNTAGLRISSSVLS
ncbi:MAG: HDOD domain-containing protein [Candidatus Competibacteraceae bacterium]|nr:HDOD domain-containing protein [Candidatus Competibacteraceae bacterium]